MRVRMARLLLRMVRQIMAADGVPFLQLLLKMLHLLLLFRPPLLLDGVLLSILRFGLFLLAMVVGAMHLLLRLLHLSADSVLHQPSLLFHQLSVGDSQFRALKVSKSRLSRKAIKLHLTVSKAHPRLTAFKVLLLISKARQHLKSSRLHLLTSKARRLLKVSRLHQLLKAIHLLASKVRRLLMVFRPYLPHGVLLRSLIHHSLLRVLHLQTKAGVLLPLLLRS
jgi:hypothetical protein